MTVKNTGNMDLTGVTLDPTGVSGCDASLPVGASTTCKAPLVIATQEDFEAGANGGWPTTVTAKTTQGVEDTATDTTMPAYSDGVEVTVVCPKDIAERERLARARLGVAAGLSQGLGAARRRRAAAGFVLQG